VTLVRWLSRPAFLQRRSHRQCRAPWRGGWAVGLAWRPLSAARRQGAQISFGVEPVLPFFAEGNQQAFAHREAARRRPPGSLNRCGVVIQRRVRLAPDDPAHGWTSDRGAVRAPPQARAVPRGRAVPPPCRASRPTAGPGDPTATGPGDPAPDPGVGGEHQAAQGLDERPLTLNRLMEQLWRQPTGPFHALAPEPLKDVPCLSEPGGVRRAHLGRPGTAGSARRR
jgi:hypothetical protein